MAKRPARPRDPMQLAKLIGDIAIGERANDSPRPGPEPEETAWRRKGGRKGGKARAKKHDKATLSKWAKKGGRPKAAARRRSKP